MDNLWITWWIKLTSKEGAGGLWISYPHPLWINSETYPPDCGYVDKLSTQNVDNSYFWHFFHVNILVIRNA
ncbi:hypothetical protein KSB_19140 [Ktedonobacter robiniae]|uniref:Uncharacterized protein n=1 Tax=Ktedonobacter robiniae TaxID=2778365 RepID=A0ABQ3UL33_9CHLR|nr:hypothetical protein KSB_19140 [Ktedonobacter robiniae]